MTPPMQAPGPSNEEPGPVQWPLKTRHNFEGPKFLVSLREGSRGPENVVDGCEIRTRNEMKSWLKPYRLLVITAESNHSLGFLNGAKGTSKPSAVSQGKDDGGRRLTKIRGGRNAANCLVSLCLCQIRGKTCATLCRLLGPAQLMELQTQSWDDHK